MKTLGIIANCMKPRAAEVLRRIERRARAHGLSLVACDDTARLLKTCKRVPAGQIKNRIDALVALGGDGTLLRAVRLIHGADIPVMGINIGGLGFLTSVAERELDRALACLRSDRFQTSRRSVAQCEVLGKHRGAAGYLALNDAVLHSGASLRVVGLDVTLNGEPVTSYVCDGLVVSTPTGSTGHSLSAGGPIVHPDSRVFVVTPICPHALSVRPLVIPDTASIGIDIVESSDDLILSVDGQQIVKVPCGARLEIRQSPHSVQFIHLPGHSYFAVLRQKLHWRGSSV